MIPEVYTFLLASIQANKIAYTQCQFTSNDGTCSGAMYDCVDLCALYDVWCWGTCAEDVAWKRKFYPDWSHGDCIPSEGDLQDIVSSCEDSTGVYPAWSLTNTPTGFPTEPLPTGSPTEPLPTRSPTGSPTLPPTGSPTGFPTDPPPTGSPTGFPTDPPPTGFPTDPPPTSSPTNPLPTDLPTSKDLGEDGSEDIESDAEEKTNENQEKKTLQIFCIVLSGLLALAIIYIITEKCAKRDNYHEPTIQITTVTRVGPSTKERNTREEEEGDDAAPPAFTARDGAEGGHCGTAI